jgi:hypothetical protein
MKKLVSLLVLATALLGMSAISANNDMKPFVLAKHGQADFAATVAETRDKLQNGGFEVVGEYSPYEGATLIVVTNDALKAAAAGSEFSMYAAGQRVSITQVGSDVQVAYTNPVYMANAYRMDNDLADIRQQLEAALGKTQEFGPEEGMDASKLRKYHYMFGMPYLDDMDELATHASYEAAIAAVEQGLATNSMGVSKVYRIDLPGKNISVFGVAMTYEKSGDKFIMSEIDFKELRSTAHLPYEFVVDGGRVYALNAKFRIAINFPDLKMMGDNSFMNIRPSPGVIEEVLSHVAKGGK